MTAPGFLTVPEHVARNPVARAIARRKVEQAVRDFLTRLYLLQPGEDVHGDVDASSHVLMVAIEVLELRGEGGSAAARVMAGAMMALTQIAERGCTWRTADAVALDVGLQHAVEVYRVAGAGETQRAWQAVQRRMLAATHVDARNSATASRGAQVRFE